MMAFTRINALVALFLGVSSAHADSLHHQATRLLRDVTESSSIHLTLTPRLDSTLALSGVTVDGVLFPRLALDGSLHFDGRLSYDRAGARHNLTLLNDRGFLTVADASSGRLDRIACIHPDNIPPLHQLTDALRSARIVNASSSPQFNVNCAKEQPRLTTARLAPSARRIRLGVVRLLHALTFFGLCTTRRSLQSIMLQGSRASSGALDARLERAVESFGRHVTSNLCAVSPAGLASKDSAMLVVLGVVSGHASLQNDGLVEFASCRGPLDALRPQINHLDATLRHGDGWWGDDRKPLKWLNCQI
ncbi:hypothetical protein ATCC90586_006169 [Pythium insidiosum]|nr:hypothetical protein ATCC90586_006169 [Pythium insidiosum]